MADVVYEDGEALLWWLQLKLHFNDRKYVLNFFYIYIMLIYLSVTVTFFLDILPYCTDCDKTIDSKLQ